MSYDLIIPTESSVQFRYFTLPELLNEQVIIYNCLHLLVLLLYRRVLYFCFRDFMNKRHYPLLTSHTIWGLCTDGVKSGYCSSLTDEVAHFSVLYYAPSPPLQYTYHWWTQTRQQNKASQKIFIKPNQTRLSKCTCAHATSLRTLLAVNWCSLHLKTLGHTFNFTRRKTLQDQNEQSWQKWGTDDLHPPAVYQLNIRSGTTNVCAFNFLRKFVLVEFEWPKKQIFIVCVYCE